MLNLTPHAISVLNQATGAVDTFPPSGTLARVAVASTEVSSSLPYSVGVTTYGSVEGIPLAATEVFLVSAMVLDRLPAEYHGWAFAPDTGPSAVRNDKGHIVHVVALKTVAK
jgi:hypothetical protein